MLNKPSYWSLATKLFLTLTLFLKGIQTLQAQNNNSFVINLVFTSDAHYAITRKTFQGDTNVNAHVVNAAMIKKINTLPQLTLPEDGGLNAGKQVGAIDYLVQTGDIANRMEIPYQSAAVSWVQFEQDYIKGVTLKNHDHKPTKLLLAPGNHDITNAIGYYKPMNPEKDPTSMVKIYDLMMKPYPTKTNSNYNYTTDKINYSLNVHGIHLIFITLWPDSAERIWIQQDLDSIAKTTPVVLFTHDQPECETKHFTNPRTPYDINSKNKFENLVAEHYKESNTATDDFGDTNIEQRGWVKFLKKHTNIKAYFHGNSNWNEFYTYKGPDNDVMLNVFRVDSPMKGKYSSKDETKLSFQLITIDPEKQAMTVRECLWNPDPLNSSQKPVFKASKTVSLKVE